MGLVECGGGVGLRARALSRPTPTYPTRLDLAWGKVALLNGYVTVRCGNAPTVAFKNASGERMRLASRIQRHPR